MPKSLQNQFPLLPQNFHLFPNHTSQIPKMPLPLLFLLLSTISTSVNAAVYGGHFPASACGNITIRYPFYLSSTYSYTNTSPFFCGYPGLALTCINNTIPYPILNLPINSTYIVKYINYVSHTVTLIDNDVVSDTSNCVRARRNLTIDNLPLTNPSLNLAFYFNCSGVDQVIEPIDCLAEVDDDGGRTGRKSYVFVSGSENSKVEWMRVCEEKVVTAVEEGRVDLGDLVGGYAEGMKFGFPLEWGMKGVLEAKCAKCEKSRGLCGTRRVDRGAAEGVEEFACYCKDGGIDAVKCKSKFSLPEALNLFCLIFVNLTVIFCGLFFVLISDFRG